MRPHPVKAFSAQRGPVPSSKRFSCRLRSTTPSVRGLAIRWGMGLPCAPHRRLFASEVPVLLDP